MTSNKGVFAASQSNTDLLLAIRQEKASIHAQLHESRQNMTDTLHGIMSPNNTNTNKVKGISSIISNGIAIWEGIRIGLSLIEAFRSFMGKKKRRK